MHSLCVYRNVETFCSRFALLKKTILRAYWKSSLHLFILILFIEKWTQASIRGRRRGFDSGFCRSNQFSMEKSNNIWGEWKKKYAQNISQQKITIAGFFIRYCAEIREFTVGGWLLLRYVMNVRCQILKTDNSIVEHFHAEACKGTRLTKKKGTRIKVLQWRWSKKSSMYMHRICIRMP